MPGCAHFGQQFSEIPRAVRAGVPPFGSGGMKAWYPPPTGIFSAPTWAVFGQRETATPAPAPERERAPDPVYIDDGRGGRMLAGFTSRRRRPD